jgi:hypothetical protein
MAMFGVHLVIDSRENIAQLSFVPSFAANLLPSDMEGQNRQPTGNALTETGLCGDCMEVM